ncbi:MAG: hypothetical protein ACI90Q_002429 [Nonlabens sp.]|jgi:hypothetical protein
MRCAAISVAARTPLNGFIFGILYFYLSCPIPTFPYLKAWE